MRLYITLHGRSTWATINSYYAALREKSLRPESVLIITEKRYLEKASAAKEGIELTSEGFGIKPGISIEVVPDAGFRETGHIVAEAAKKAVETGSEVYLDITPGRKPLVSGALLALSKIPVNRVLYLMVEPLDEVSKPYPMIPLQTQHLIDFLEERR